MANTLYCKDLTHFVTVDDEDWQWLRPLNGSLSYNERSGFYWIEKRVMRYVHREIMARLEDVTDKQVCFVKRDLTDCRRQNLFVFDPAVDPPSKKSKIRKERLQQNAV